MAEKYDELWVATGKGPTWGQIHTVVQQRQNDNSAAINEMQQVRNRYNADWVLPLPDVKDEPTLPQIGPALIAESIDSVALMASSVRPAFNCPPLNPANETGMNSRQRAEVRRKVLYATWHASKGSLLRRRGYRHLAGYATMCMIARPDFALGHPVIEIRDPLGCYPEPKAPEDLTPPRDLAYIYQRSAAFLRATYPKSRRENGGPIGEPGKTTEELWDLVEWNDAECCVIGILGPCSNRQMSATWALSQVSAGRASSYHDGPMTSFPLFRWENKSGRPPAISLPRITLDRVASQIAHQVGNVDLMTQLLALAIAAEERNVFADKYAIGRGNARPTIVTNNGNWEDGRTGKINLLMDVEQVGAMQTPSAPGALQMIDRLEGDMRGSVGLMRQFGGESSGSMRTGRGLDTLIGVAVDPRVQELQEIMEMGLPHLNEIIFDQYTAYWPEKKMVMMTGWSGMSSLVEFTPKTHIEATFNTVKYPILGMDAQGLTVTLGQLLSMNAISLTTLRQMHPYIDDPDSEARLALEEMLEKAVFDSLAQGAVNGQQDPVRLAKIQKEVKKPGVDIFMAIEAVDEEMRKMQATPAPAPEPGLVAPPELMPGMAAPPGTPAMQPPSTQPPVPMVGGPNDNQQRLSDLVQALGATG